MRPKSEPSLFVHLIWLNKLFRFSVAEHWNRGWKNRGVRWHLLCALWHPVAPRGSRVSARRRREDVLLCSSDSSLWGSSCWVHSFTVLIASRFVDNFIRCLTKDNYQHNKTLKYLVLIFLCGYSVNILMQNVSEKCLRTPRQCEIPVG